MPAEKTALLPVSADEAFALLTEPDRLRRWQTVSARVDLRAGGEYRWTVVPGHIAAGTFKEIEPGKRLVFGWGWEGTPDLGPDASTVTITLEPAEGGTLVKLVHEGLTDEQAASHLEGWTHYFQRLEAAAGSGDAGPDEWAAAPADLDPLACADATLAVLQQVLRGVSEDQLKLQTPCSEFSVSALTDHLLGGLGQLAAMAGGSVTQPESGPLESRVAVVAQQAVEAWQKRGIEGLVPFGPNEVPAAVPVSILSLEFLVHAWDYATATGQAVPVSAEVSEYVLKLAEQTIQPEQRAGGAFAAEVQPGPDADGLQRLIAFSGRQA